MKNLKLRVFGILFFIIGAFLLVDSQANITASVVGSASTGYISILALAFIMAGIYMMMANEFFRFKEEY